MFPPRAKPAHHQGRYRTEAPRIVAAANADPETRCWRCGLRIHECRPHRNGKPAHWTAGHLNDGEVDGDLAPECSSCNASAGAQLAARRSHEARQRNARNTSRDW